MRSVPLYISAAALVCAASAFPANAAHAQSKRTKSGYAACFTREDHSKFTRYLVNKDMEAAQGLIESRRCIMLKAGVEVFIEDTAVFSGMIKIRPRGMEATLWTNIEAVD